jgi:hypothetical protein
MIFSEGYKKITTLPQNPTPPILPQTGSKTDQLSPQRKKSPRMRAFCFIQIRNLAHFMTM